MGTVIRYRMTSVSFREQRRIAQLGVCIIKIFTATLQTAWTSYTACPGLWRYLAAVELGSMIRREQGAGRIWSKGQSDSNGCVCVSSANFAIVRTRSRSFELQLLAESSLWPQISIQHNLKRSTRKLTDVS